jgi:O-antigen/teichoic acid export membrane protein
VLRVFYGPDSPYGAVAGELPVFVVAYGCTYVSAFLAALLTSLDRSRFVFLAQAASAASALVIGLPLIALLGLMGAAWGSVATSVAFSGTCLLLLWRARSPHACHNWLGR